MSTRRVLFRLPAAREDDLAAELWELGTLGLQLLPPPGAVLPWSGPDDPDEEIRLEAWFPEDMEPDWNAIPVGRWVEASEPQEDRDWLEVWRRQARPMAVGRRLLIDPREPGETSEIGVPAREDGRHTLHLPARNAFGTGSHESTRLALLLLERLDLEGRRVLDAGTGTGVLAFAALLAGARMAVGYDIDPAAAVHARDNGRRNDLSPRLFAGTGVALAPKPGTFDLLVINMIPENALPELPHLLSLLSPGAEMVLSGCLGEHVERVAGELDEMGLRVRETIHEGEWAGMVSVWKGGDR